MNIMIINGPNLNFLGLREPNIYGNSTYEDLKLFLQVLAQRTSSHLTVYQTNYEGKIIDYLQEAKLNNYDAVIINPGALTHYSYAIYDAILAIALPTIEVHLSNIEAREDFRKISVIRPACKACFMGEHFKSYENALNYLLKGNSNE